MKASSAVILCAIPAVLAVGALYWLTFGERVNQDVRTAAQEARAAELVGAKPVPVAPLQFSITPSQRDPVTIYHAIVDGDTLVVYYRNDGRTKATSIHLAYKLVSPDGTIIGGQDGYASIYWDSVDALDPGEKAEGRIEINADRRGATLKLSAYSETQSGASW